MAAAITAIETGGGSDNSLWDAETEANLISNRSAITTIALPSGITNITAHAFCGCINLNIDRLPDTITSIGTYAFDNCNNLVLTELPNTLTNIKVWK